MKKTKVLVESVVGINAFTLSLSLAISKGVFRDIYRSAATPSVQAPTAAYVGFAERHLVLKSKPSN